MSRSGLLRESLIVLRKEVRTLARDRHVVIYSVLLPLVLYPGLVWLAIQIALYLQGEEERLVSRVLVDGAERDDPFVRFLGENGVEIVSPAPGAPPAAAVRSAATVPGAEAARRAIASGVADALVWVERLPGATGVRIGEYHSGARSASVLASKRIAGIAQKYRQKSLDEAARRAGEGEGFLRVLDVEELDQSSPQEIANYVASMVLPLLMVVMTALGALYPALDATVGERERGTLETTLISPVSRRAIVLGKYGAVVLFAYLAFVLNCGSMGFTLAHLQAQFRIGSFRLDPTAALVILAAALLLALLLGAAMMALAFLARTFREGQALVTPLYLLAVIPALVTSAPDAKLTLVLAAVPVVNVSLLFRGLLRGTTSGPAMAVTFATSAGAVILALFLAVRLMRREELVSGSEAGPADFVRALLGRRRREAGPGSSAPEARR